MDIIIDEVLLSLKKYSGSGDGITVGLGQRSYPIIFGRNNLASLGALCMELGLRGCAAVVTNTTVGPLYADQVAESLNAAGYSVRKVELPDGEEYKNSETLNGIYDKLLEYGLDRGAFIVALGGGVIGDMAGFASATFLRGIPFVQVPTTLLAQVDSSVGGKTGINHPRGKNLIGAFYQPRLVLIDVMVLDTLPEREYLSGLAEVIKYGVVLDKDLFVDLSTNVDKLLNRDKDFLQVVIKRSCAIKASVVEQDEREAGVRAVLNFGHTLGHAVESLTGYTTYLHGEAVAIGMAQAANYSACIGYCSNDEAALIVDLLKKLHLPVAMPDFSVAAYTEAIAHDKKVRDGSLGFVFNRGIGSYHLGRVTDVSQLLKSCGIGA
jgi:3-dehydroquinate synthase